MKIVKFICVSLVLNFASLAWAENVELEKTEIENAAYISDDLFIYMHSGPGNHYRILGSINSGTEVSLTGESSEGYTQIFDTKGRKTWVEDKYVSTNPGLRNIIAELNGKLANYSEKESNTTLQLSDANSRIEALEEQNKDLNKTIQGLNIDLTYTKSQLKDQDMNIKKQWFFNGAIVLSIGLLLGILIPKIGARRKPSMDSWK